MRGDPQKLPYNLARAYAHLGYAVLPLAPGEKRPHPGLVPHGLKEASRGLEALRAWWRACPRCGVGILAPEEVLVLDFDDPTAWEGLKGEYPTLGDAPRQRTPKGGYHVFLQLPQGVRLSATTRALEGVDLRGMGRAYVVAAPTRLADGRGYTWEVPLVRPARLPLTPEGLLLQLLPPPPPPREVVVEGSSPRRLRALLEAYAAAVASAPEGTRHNTLIRYAVATGGLIPHGLDPREAEEVLVAAALEAGLPEREAWDAVRWGLEAGVKAPLDLGEAFTAKAGVFRKPLCGKPEPSPSQNSVFRKTATHRMGLRKREGVL
jgi:Bifunctional DNA primase/polymerase, N-terminal.